MNSNITRDGHLVRPSFNHSAPGGSGRFLHDAIAAQLLESLRNVNEGCLNAIACDLECIRETLNRIDRRLAKRISLNSRDK